MGGLLRRSSLRLRRLDKPEDECEEGILRSLGEGGYASEGCALRSAVEGATGVKPWGSTIG